LGLDTVELIMEVEKEFGIQIEDQRASRLQTVGDLLVCVLDLMRRGGNHPNLDVVWERLRVIVGGQAKIPKEQVTRMTHLLYDLA
jgi:hypothetical protein